MIYARANGSSPSSTPTTFSVVRAGSFFESTETGTPFKFTASNLYIINSRRASGTLFDGFKVFDCFIDSGLPVTVGLIRLVDGIEGFGATNAGNFVHPSFRYRTGDVVVPAPAELALFGFGAFALGVSRRRG